MTIVKKAPSSGANVDHKSGTENLVEIFFAKQIGINNNKAIYSSRSREYSIA